MSTNVTVLGANGSTLTIPFTSAANAAAAQSALSLINFLITNGLVTQTNMTLLGLFPTPSGAAPLGGAIATGAGLGVNQTLPYGVVDIIDNTVGANNLVQVTTPSNVVTVAGGGGLTLFNQSAAADVFLTNTLNPNTNSFYSGYGAPGIAVSAQIAIDSGTSATLLDYGGGANTITAYGGGGTLNFQRNPYGLGAGSWVVNLVAGAGTQVIRQFTGTGT